MVNTVILTAGEQIQFKVPLDYIGKKIKIIFFPVEEEKLVDPPFEKKSMASFWGTISKETAKDMHETLERDRNNW